MNKSIAMLLSIISLNSYSLDIPKDKKLHFAVSTFIATATTLITEDKKTTILTCLSIGLGKEIYDEYTYGGFDEKDLLFDGLGCFSGISLGLESLRIYSNKQGNENSIGIEYSMKL